MINSWKFERLPLPAVVAVASRQPLPLAVVIRFPTLGKAGETPAVRFPTLGTFSSNAWKQPSPTCPAEALAKEEGYGGQEICAYLRPSADAFFPTFGEAVVV